MINKQNIVNIIFDDKSTFKESINFDTLVF